MPTPAAAGRGNLVRQAISLLVHFPGAGPSVPPHDELVGVDRPGVALLVELLAQLREDPVTSTAALLERWRDRPEHGPLEKLATAECLVPDEAAAAAEIRSALERLVTEHTLVRLQVLEDKARDEPLNAAEKAELQGLLRAKGQSGRGAAPK
jgi:DNA primase